MKIIKAKDIDSKNKIYTLDYSSNVSNKFVAFSELPLRQIYSSDFKSEKTKIYENTSIDEFS